MRYIKVKWMHNSLSDPILMYSEIDDERWEVRKVEVFSDGRMGFSDGASSFLSTWLGQIPVPSLEEIASDSHFSPAEISVQQFEELWKKAKLQSK